MQVLSEEEVLRRIAASETFDSVLVEGCFELKILEYVPLVCTAIHAGSNLRAGLDCLLKPEERRLEEDPGTDLFIRSFPITLIGCDSRYEYDLNRDPENCIYVEVWGRKVWASALSKQQREVSLEKHALYYRVLKALLEKLENPLVLDVHSYNFKIRQYEQAPVFNIGTFPIDMKRWGHLVNKFAESLKKIEDVGFNVVFEGKGYQTAFIKEHFPEVLAIPLEIKKVYMDEQTGELFSSAAKKIEQGICQSLPNPRIEPLVFEIDHALFVLAKGIETLSYVNPINLREEKDRFLSEREYTPQFLYRQLGINPYKFREELYALPVSKIKDPLLRVLYISVVDGFAKKIDLLTSIGSPQFLYNSLRHYGEPSSQDIANAHFILHCKERFNSEEIFLPASEVKKRFEHVLQEHGIDFQVVLSDNLVAKAMVENSTNTLFLNSAAMVTEIELKALINHEFGIHVLTTVNARLQQLRIFSLGLPGATHTQEGLAILSEYLSGSLTLTRLKTIALRVFAIHMMIKGMGFHAVYSRLKEEYGQTGEVAFDLTVRAFRGGGFTKDYLYLSGFRDVIHQYRKRPLNSLMVGKTSLGFLDILDQLIERGVLEKPAHIPRSLKAPVESNPILNYIVDCIN